MKNLAPYATAGRLFFLYEKEKTQKKSIPKRGENVHNKMVVSLIPSPFTLLFSPPFGNPRDAQRRKMVEKGGNKRSYFDNQALKLLFL